MSPRAGSASIEAALVIVVPEAEALVRPYRLEYDPSAAKGMPAHITINYPFLPGVKVSPLSLARLRALAAGVPAFIYRLARTARFPEVLYLAPEPSGPFQELATRVVEAFPESPAYSGQYPGVVPHLTVAQVDDAPLLDGIAADFGSGADPQLPILCRATQLWLMDNREGRWKKRTAFRLGGASRPDPSGADQLGAKP